MYALYPFFNDYINANEFDVNSTNMNNTTIKIDLEHKY